MTPRCNYFLAGRGGPLSMFGKKGEGLIPPTLDEAKKWGHNHLPTRTNGLTMGASVRLSCLP